MCGVQQGGVPRDPCGSAGGPDKLRPQHLKDLLQHVGVDDLESPFLSALVAFCNLVLRGETPVEVRPFFFGASLVALRKKCGGVRPIAVGCSLRRLVAKVACELLAPRQLGFGVCGGSEAAVHAARRFLSAMGEDQAVVKLDFTNAFNSIRRDCVLEAVQSRCPSLYAFAQRTVLHLTSFGVTGRSPQLKGCSKVTLWGPCSSVWFYTSTASI